MCPMTFDEDLNRLKRELVMCFVRSGIIVDRRLIAVLSQEDLVREAHSMLFSFNWNASDLYIGLCRHNLEFTEDELDDLTLRYGRHRL